MQLSHLRDVLQCSAGTYASITGLRLNNEIGEFSGWIARNYRDLPEGENLLITIKLCWDLFQEGDAEARDTVFDDDSARCLSPENPVFRGMSVEVAKSYLEGRGLESLVPGGFSTLNAMQRGLR